MSVPSLSPLDPQRRKPPTPELLDASGAPGISEPLRAARQNDLQRRFYEESLALFEERLVRIENSALFRFNRAVGSLLRNASQRWQRLASRVPFYPVLTGAVPKSIDAYRQWVSNQEAEFPSFERHREMSRAWVSRPRISILLPVFDTTRQWLEEAIRSVRNQSYEDWQLCICHTSQDALIAEYLAAEFGAGCAHCRCFRFGGRRLGGYQSGIAARPWRIRGIPPVRRCFTRLRPSLHCGSTAIRGRLGLHGRGPPG